MPDSVRKVLVYARVSTERDQSPDAQVQELQQYCEARKWHIIEEIVDHGYSGGTDQRPGLKKLMLLARSRKVDCVVVVKLDRIARSLKHLVTMLDEFQELEIQFVSIHDQIDLTTASGRLMFHIIAAFAEFERALIRERTVLGLIHARSKGKRLGRPRIHNQEEIRRLRAKGMSYRQISHELNAPMGTITKAIKSAHLSSSESTTKNSTKSGGKNV